MDTQTDRGRQTDRQTDIQADRQTDRQTQLSFFVSVLLGYSEQLNCFFFNICSGIVVAGGGFSGFCILGNLSFFLVYAWPTHSVVGFAHLARKASPRVLAPTPHLSEGRRPTPLGRQGPVPCLFASAFAAGTGLTQGHPTHVFTCSFSLC